MRAMCPLRYSKYFSLKKRVIFEGEKVIHIDSLDSVYKNFNIYIK